LDVIEAEVTDQELAELTVPQVGRIEQTGNPWMPYRLLDTAGVPVEPASEFFRDLQAAGRSPATVRSYGMDLPRWFRFLWAIGIGWDRATRVEARDFCRWMLVAGKPSRPHWRNPGKVVGDALQAPSDGRL
jgi:Phage integrase, N-terminal SAM-like domain